MYRYMYIQNKRRVVVALVSVVSALWLSFNEGSATLVPLNKFHFGDTRPWDGMNVSKCVCYSVRSLRYMEIAPLLVLLLLYF